MQITALLQPKLFLCGELWYLLVHKNLMCSRTSRWVPFQDCLSLTGFSLYPVKLCSYWNMEPVVWLQKRRNKLIPSLKWQSITDVAPAFNPGWNHYLLTSVRGMIWSRQKISPLYLFSLTIFLICHLCQHPWSKND